MWFGSMLAAVCVARVRNWVLRSNWLVVVFSVAVTSSSVSWCETSSWSSGKCVRFGAGWSRVRLSSGSYQDLVNWYCSLLTRRTVYGRAAGNSTRTTTKINKWNEPWNCRNSVVALQDHCSYKAPTTNHHIKQVDVSMFASCRFTFCSCFFRCHVSAN